MSDHTLYTQALVSAEVEDCVPIRSDALRGECMVLPLKHAVRSDPEGAATVCEHPALSPDWQAECWFILADGSNAVGAEADTICARAGRFRGPCQAHTAIREARIGDPNDPAVEARLVELLSATQSPKRAREEARELLTR